MEKNEALAAESFLLRHEFLLRRLHSLSGLVPIGAYMVVHLLTNLSLLASPGMYQRNVYTIHSLGPALWVVEWTFIFIPLLFHAIYGMMIIAGATPNTTNYPLSGNVRYTLQRATGMIAFAFIFWHVFHMRGWIHEPWWIKHVTEPLGGGLFRPYNAASSVGRAMQGPIVNLLYAVGVAACVFHLANGLWTMGITWGVWTSEAAQRRALRICGGFGGLLAIVAAGTGAQYAAWAVGHPPALGDAVHIENRIYEAKLQSGEIDPSPEKRTAASDATARLQETIRDGR